MLQKRHFAARTPRQKIGFVPVAAHPALEALLQRTKKRAGKRSKKNCRFRDILRRSKIKLAPAKQHCGEIGNRA
jgi:hypothetical protein